MPRVFADLAIFFKIDDTRRASDTKLMNRGKCSDSKDIWNNIDYISIRRENVGSMSNRCQSNGLCYIGGSHKFNKNDHKKTTHNIAVCTTRDTYYMCKVISQKQISESDKIDLLQILPYNHTSYINYKRICTYQYIQY